VRIDPAACNALTRTAHGLLVPQTLLETGPGLRLTPPQEDDCPQVWRLDLNAAWTQTPATLAFRHDLTGAAREWEIVSEVPTLTIPRAGAWEVNFQARGLIELTANQGPTAVAAGVTVAMFKNDVLVNGTEALVVHANEPVNDQGKHLQTTASRQFIHGFNEGDTIQLAARRTTTTGTAAVVSNADGRTYLTAHWLGPQGDTAG
jgi:hypothetical protein